MSRCSIHISVQIPHQDGMLPLVSTMPLHNLHFLLSESIYRQQHVCSNLVTLKDLQGISGGFKIHFILDFSVCSGRTENSEMLFLGSQKFSFLNIDRPVNNCKTKYNKQKTFK